MDVRLEKARAIVSTVKVRKQGGAWLVPSQTGHGKGYVVTWQERDPEGWRYANGDQPGYRCTCPDYEHRHRDCKHILAVCLVLTKETERTETTAPDGTKTVTTRTRTTATLNTQRPTYPQNWPAYNKAQTEEKATFLRLLADLCTTIPQPEQTGKNSGRKRLALRDMVFAAVFKVYSTFSGRRFMTDLADAQAKGYIAKTPHFNSIFNYLEMPELTPLLTELVTLSALPLASVETSFAVDSTGFATTKFVRWYDHKYGDIKEQHDWLKLHAMCGVKTHVITAAQVSHGSANDSPFFAPLVAKTATGFSMDEVSADKAYSSRLNTMAVWKADAMPYIPYRAGTSALGTKPGSPLWRRLFHFYNMERDAFNARYHQRSNVESAFSMMKRKFGDALRSKTQVAQFNEALCKVLCHNICCLIQSMHELGIAPTFWGQAQTA